ncbi:1-deoxy-D-xylulose-5-phosphate reductoisomerase [bacterium]|nr:1-deoxy-D-xylulose-5-phosphate reductoisomerase [bacterium]
MIKKIALLGSTGSIGRMTLDIVRRFPEKFAIVALAAGSNVELLRQQMIEFRPGLISVGSQEHRDFLYQVSDEHNREYVFGQDGLKQAASISDADMVISALSGSAGMLPTKIALAAGKDVGLANKESMVMAGHYLTKLARDKGSRIIPIDSEHSAIFQCLQGNRAEDIRSLILTASGGPFIDYSGSQLETVTPAQALSHPIWAMGPKITIDSATLMNKGLEVIEARWLFGIPSDRIEVVVHRQSVIHSMVRYHDGSIISQLGCPDMRIPILYALTYPERWSLDLPQLDLIETRQLTFEEPDHDRFPCLALAYEALKMGGSAPIVLNSSDEVAVQAFLDNRIRLDQIPKVISQTLEKEGTSQVQSFDDIIAVDMQARVQAERTINQIGREHDCS